MEVTYRYYELLVSICAETIWNKIHELSEERCSGCETEHPSQWEHSCLMDSKQMKLIMLFDLAYMKLNIREVLNNMLKNHDCGWSEIVSLWEYMKTYRFTDIWKSELYSQLEKEASGE